MSKIKALVAAALITIPALGLDAAQVQMPQGAEPFMSDTRPTTSQMCCLYFYWNGILICVPC